MLGKFAAAYTATLGSRTYRVVNQNDVVPRLPGWLLGFRHFGQLQFITPFGQLIPNAPLWALALCDAFGLWQAYRLRKDVLLTDHFMADYQKNL